MQLTFSCAPPSHDAIERTMSAARLGRYMAEARNDRYYALRLYIWNVSLCQALYLPVQMCEVAFRNAMHGSLVQKFGATWHRVEAFRLTLPKRLLDELDAAIANERTVYGPRMTVDHVVSALSFGFWQNLLTQKYDGALWPKLFASSFPALPARIGRLHLYQRVDRLRLLRNRLAHHKPIFDRGPGADFVNIVELTGWMCPQTAWMLGRLARVRQTINSKPAC